MNKLFIIVAIVAVLVVLLCIVLYKNTQNTTKDYETLAWNNVLHVNKERLENITSNTNNVVFLLSYSYKIFPKYYYYSKEILTKYCNKHNYTLIEKNHSDTEKDELISPYWLRVKDLLIMTREYPENTLFVYLDLDATINPEFFDISIEKLLEMIDFTSNTTYSMYIGTDPIYVNIDYSNTLNSGVMIIKNNNWSKNFLKKWFDRYINLYWKFNHSTGKWICSYTNNMQCPWAKSAYEQGQLNLMYNENSLDERKHICKLHWTILSNLDMSIKSFIYHFMAHSETQRVFNIKKLMQKIKYE